MNYKKFLVAGLLMISAHVVSAQITIDSTGKEDDQEIVIDRYQNKANQKPISRLFFGGGLAVGGGSGGAAVGVNPLVGYSPSKYWDLGLALNFNYNSVSKDYSWDNVSQKLTTYGVGPFVRFNPVSFLFVQGQFEENWGTFKYGSDKTTFNAASLIGSVGYISRFSNAGSYFFSIGMDFLKNQYSPYRDVDYDQNGKVSSNTPIPIIRGGVFIYLHK